MQKASRWPSIKAHKPVPFQKLRHMIKFKRLVVIGVGLIGGSFALALKRAAVVDEVIGVDRSDAALNDALRLKVIDVALSLSDAPQGAKGADLVLLAVPVRQMAAAFALINPLLGDHTIVMDCGSTKQDVIGVAVEKLGIKIAQFVPAHPIAGRETSGDAVKVTVLPKAPSFSLIACPRAWTAGGCDSPTSTTAAPAWARRSFTSGPTQSACAALAPSTARPTPAPMARARPSISDERRGRL